MKTTLLVLAAMAAFSSAAIAQGQVSPGAVKVSKCEHKLVPTPQFQITGGQNKRYKVGEWLEVEVEFESTPEEIDELTFKYTVLIDKKVVEGEVTHVNIPKGRDHFSVVYIAPRSLEKLVGSKIVNAAHIQAVWVEVSRQGQLLAKFPQQGPAIPNVQRFPGVQLLNKLQTPFAPLYFDRYEAIKQQR